MSAAERVAILRTGIRLRNTLAARTCAGLLEWKHLDDWEQGLMTRLGADAVVDPAYRDEQGNRPSLGGIFECASGAELPYVLDRVAEHAATLEDAGNLSILHKSASAEHLPQLARVALSPVAELRKHALDMIQTVAIHTDQHREDVAAALLGLSIDNAQRRFPYTGEGVPPLLAAVLSLKQFPFDPNSKFRDWAWRWLADTHPAPRDVEFLLKLDANAGSDVIAWILRDVADPRIDPWLVATTSEPEPARPGTTERPASPSPIRLGVLAHRGHGDALARLLASAQDDAESLSVLLSIAPERGRALVEERVFGEDAAVAFEMLRDLRDAWETVPAWAGITWDDYVFERFADAALTRNLDGARLAQIGVSVPRCRTRVIAAAAIASMSHDTIPVAADERPLELDGDVGAFLETAAPDAFRDVLRQWAHAADEATRKAALEALAHVGDPASGPLLVEAARRGDIETEILARSPCPAVLGYLREKGRDDFAAAVAYGHATGLPEGVGLLTFCTDEEEPLPSGVRDAVRASLLDGRWKDAVARALNAAPDHGAGDQGMDAVGLVDDDRVRAYLHRLQEHRELRLYPWATAELANMGDPVARVEYEHALRIGRYRWGDESEQIGFRDGLRALPFWLDLMETNCCRFASIRCFVFDHWFDLEFQTEGGRGLSTPVEEARRFVARSGGRFVWSRVKSRYLGGCFVPAPK